MTVTLEELATARQNMLEAWDAQSKTTVEDGYTFDQALAAIAQALDAQREYDRLCDLREEELTCLCSIVEEASTAYFRHWYA